MDAFGELQTIPPQSIIAQSDEDLRRPWQARRRRSLGECW